jgi:hypothetical protein
LAPGISAALDFFDKPAMDIVTADIPAILKNVRLSTFFILNPPRILDFIALERESFAKAVWVYDTKIEYFVNPKNEIVKIIF